jgi:CheY-like chemotaxis protein
MPRKTGGQAAAALRSLVYVGPIVGITGNALSEDVASFTRMGADRVLSKPVEVAVLLQVIAAALLPAARVASP